jgi:hypothetical protein
MKKSFETATWLATTARWAGVNCAEGAGGGGVGGRAAAAAASSTAAAAQGTQERRRAHD